MRYILKIILLFLGLQCVGQSPNWQAPDASQYSFSMNAIVELRVDQVYSNNLLDTVAFFVGNELRGLGTSVDLGSGVILHFVTLYSNVSAETMTIKAYHYENGLVLDVANTVQFVPQTVLGSISTPYTLEAYFNTSPPFSIDPLPFQSTIEGVPIDTLNLNNYLAQNSSNGVTWSYATNASLQVTLLDSLLVVEGNQGFIGTTVLGLTATENNAGGNSASTGLFVNIGQSFQNPYFDIDIMQGRIRGDTFSSMDLTFHENLYDGPCLTYSYKPLLLPLANPVSKPNWSVNSSGSTTMNLVIKADYTPQLNLTDPDDELGVFVDGQLRAVGDKVIYQGDVLYYVTLAGNGPESIPLEVRFYSAVAGNIYTKPTLITYYPNAIYGSPSQPVVIDYSPLLPSIQSNGILSIEVVDTNWIGEQSIEIIAQDCTYPDYIYGLDTAHFCVQHFNTDLQTYYIDQDSDGFGSSSISTLACDDTYQGWVSNNEDCNDLDPLETAITYTLDIMEQSVLPNDAHVCSGSNVTLSVNTQANLVWFDGSLLSSRVFNVINNDTLRFTLMDGTCTTIIEPTILVESNTVTSSLDQGPGSIRSVITCASNHDNVYFNQAVIDTCYIIGDFILDKTLTLHGESSSNRPVLSLNLQNTNEGIRVSNLSALKLKDVDLHLNTASQSNGQIPFFGPGELLLEGKTQLNP